MKTWLACLLGKKSAILELAGERGALNAGLLLLLSAGLAREYDGVFLPLEPWRLLVPFAVSAGMGALLWCAFFLRGRRQPGAVHLRSFLGVFWTSAPLAWIYGVPYERFLAPLDAFHANLWTLALVSIWRVAWVSRVIGVLHGCKPLPALARVLFCADAVVFVVAYLAPQPVTDFMSGNRGSPLEQAVGFTNIQLMWIAGLAFPLLGVLVLVSRIGRQRLVVRPPEVESRALTRFAGLSVGAWLLVSLPVQPEQFRRWSVERDLRAGRIPEALAAMSARSPDDFPPQWDPPPHAIFEDDEPPIQSILTAILEKPVPDWVAERFAPKIFHGYYGYDDSYADKLEGLIAWWAGSRGEDEARALLELIAAHAGLLTPRQREAVDDLLARARAGMRLLPDAGDQ